MPYKDSIKQKEAQRKHYLENKEKFLSRNLQNRRKRQRWFQEEVMKNVVCMLCSEDCSACIDWHHKDPSKKDFAISQLIKRTTKKDRILEEIKKCVPVCANCHRKVHAGIFKLA